MADNGGRNFVAIQQILLLWLGIRQVVSHEITLADLVSLLLYAMLMTRPISGLANVYGQVQ